MTADELLAPVDDLSPAGADLSYDPERHRIEAAFDQAAQDDGDVDWRETIGLIEAQSRRTQDVWLAVALARAGARAGRMETVEAGIGWLAGLFERYWDTAHPLIEEYGLQGRKGPCESLTRIGDFIGPLRRATLIAHPRFGRFSGDDLDRFARDGAAAEGYGAFRAALAEMPHEAVLDEVARLDRIRVALLDADTALSAHAAETGDTGTNFQTTFAAIDTIRGALASLAGLDATGEADASDAVDTADGTATSAPAPALGGAAGSGRVESREDVARALDVVIEYYRRREPSSPIPVALERIKGWINKDFLAILQDIAPGGVSDATMVLSTRTTEEGGSSW